MPRPMDLSGIVSTTQRVRNYVWESKNVTKIPSVDAILYVTDVPEDSVAFDFQDERIIMYANRKDGVSSMVITSPAAHGGVAPYTAEEAIRGLLSYLGLTIISFGGVAPGLEAKAYLRSLTMLDRGPSWDVAPRFKDVDKLFALAEDVYRILCWSDTDATL